MDDYKVKYAGKYTLYCKVTEVKWILIDIKGFWMFLLHIKYKGYLKWFIALDTLIMFKMIH